MAGSFADNFICIFVKIWMVIKILSKGILGGPVDEKSTISQGKVSCITRWQIHYLKLMLTFMA